MQDDSRNARVQRVAGLEEGLGQSVEKVVGVALVVDKWKSLPDTPSTSSDGEGQVVEEVMSPARVHLYTPRGNDSRETIRVGLGYT